MTINEAIEQLKDLRDDRKSFLNSGDPEIYKADIEAIDIALEALRRPTDNV